MNLKARLDRLEANAPDGRAAVVWREMDETDEQALVRHFGDAPRPLNLMVAGWSDDPTTATPDPSRIAGGDA